MNQEFDVAIIGGGPAGATVGTLLKKYNPALKVLILEREKFPRDHIGESQLPLVSRVLDEMGVWDKVEAANFPIKIGATYRWGRTDDLWDFDFLHEGKFADEPRPGKYEGQRKGTAFQVDRAIFDEILLNHCEEMGCEVRQETGVREVVRTGDHVDGLVLSDGSTVSARYYVDASGNSGILRRAMDVPVDTADSLQNVAFWKYYRNTEWAVKIGVGGTRIQILAQKVGWIWFIPLGPDRTSIGYVLPGAYYKESKKRPEELFEEVMTSDVILQRLLKNATAEDGIFGTKDWSYVADRLTGDNWFLAGECAGFADPILSAGMSLAHAGGREVAYAILELDRGEYEPGWLKSQYCLNHRGHIRQHIRFADFWYTARGEFPDLAEHAKEIAKDAGLDITAKQAWMWLGQGGFIDSNGSTDIGFFGPLGTKALISSFTGDDVYFEIAGKTHFKMNLEGADSYYTATLSDGKISRHRAFRRENQVLPLLLHVGWLARFLMVERTFMEIKAAARNQAIAEQYDEETSRMFWSTIVESLESLVSYGWVSASIKPGAKPCPNLQVDMHTEFHANRDESGMLAQ